MFICIMTGNKILEHDSALINRQQINLEKLAVYLLFSIQIK